MNLNNSFSRDSPVPNSSNHSNSALPYIPNNNYKSGERRNSYELRRSRMRPPSSRNNTSSQNANNSFHMPKSQTNNVEQNGPSESTAQNNSFSIVRTQSGYQPREKSWIEMVHKANERPGKLSIPEVRQRIDEASPDYSLLELNKRLQEDLAAVTENYMKLFVEHTNLQDEHNRVVLKKTNQIKQYKEELLTKQLEVEQMKKEMEEKEKSELTLRLDLETRMHRLKEDLALERDERTTLVERLSELKSRVYEIEGSKDPSSRNINSADPQTRIKLEEKINSLKIELDLSRTKLIESQLLSDEDKLIREGFMRESKKICRFGRIHFLGDPKPIEEVFGILEKLGSTNLTARDRLFGLEQLCVFITSNQETVEKLSSMGGAIQISKSLSSHDPAILLRAAHLISHLCEHNKTSAKQVIDNGGVLYLKSCLASSDETTRVEAMAALATISQLPECIPLIAKDAGIGKIITLMEEGLQLDTEVGIELAKQAAQTLCHIAKIPTGIKEIKSFGGSFTLFRALMKESVPLRKVVVDCLVCCSSEAKYKQSFISGKLIKLLISLLKVDDADLVNRAARLIANISDIALIQDDLRRAENIKVIIDLVDNEESEYLIIVLGIIQSLCQNKKLVRSICRSGLIKKINKLLIFHEKEIRKDSAKVLSSISTFPDITEKYVTPVIMWDHIIGNLDYEENVETARFCFSSLHNLIQVAIYDLPIEKELNIIPHAVRMLGARLPFEHLKECISLIPLLVYVDEVRQAIFDSKVDITLAKLLKTNLQFVQKEFDDVFCSIMDFLIVVTDEEFQHPNTRRAKNKDSKDEQSIFANCIEEEGLLDTLSDVLFVYSKEDRLNWKVLQKALQAIEVLSNSTEYSDYFIKKAVVKQAMLILQMSEAAKNEAVSISVISLLVFYSDIETEWLDMTRVYLTKALCNLLIGGNYFAKMRAKACLYDLSFCSMLAQTFTEATADDCSKMLVELYQREEEGIKEILVNLAFDIKFRAKLKSLLPHRIIVMANGQDVPGSDFLRQISNEVKFKVKREKFFTVGELMGQGYDERSKSIYHMTDRGHSDYTAADRVKKRSKKRGGIEPINPNEIGADSIKYYRQNSENEESSELSETNRSGRTTLKSNTVTRRTSETPSNSQNPTHTYTQSQTQTISGSLRGKGRRNNDDGSEYDIKSENQSIDPSEVASTERIQNHRTRIIEAQRRFFGRNVQPDSKRRLSSRSVSSRASDLGEKDKANIAGNPWNKIMNKETPRSIDEEDEYDEEDDYDGESEMPSNVKQAQRAESRNFDKNRNKASSQTYEDDEDDYDEEGEDEENHTSQHDRSQHTGSPHIQHTNQGSQQPRSSAQNIQHPQLPQQQRPPPSQQQRSNR